MWFLWHLNQLEAAGQLLCSLNHSLGGVQIEPCLYQLWTLRSVWLHPPCLTLCDGDNNCKVNPSLHSSSPFLHWPHLPVHVCCIFFHQFWAYIDVFDLDNKRGRCLFVAMQPPILKIFDIPDYTRLCCFTSKLDGKSSKHLVTRLIISKNDGKCHLQNMGALLLEGLFYNF